MAGFTIEIPYELIRSGRKTVALEIAHGGKLIVRAPGRIGKSAVDDFVCSKRKWIYAKQREAAASLEKYAGVSILNGGKLPYLGKMHSVLREEHGEIRLSEGILGIPQRFSEADVISWMKAEALRVISGRTEKYAQELGAVYSAVKITSAKSRWGSCSAKNSLSFTWRLIMCPLDIIDYVVVHELCHIAYKNHGCAFWNAVAAAMPDFAERRRRLSESRGLMEIFETQS